MQQNTINLVIPDRKHLINNVTVELGEIIEALPDQTDITSIWNKVHEYLKFNTNVTESEYDQITQNILNIIGES